MIVQRNEYVEEKISKLLNSSEDKKITVIVPEQYTFVTERVLSEIIDPTKLDNVDITSFSRLAMKLVKNSFMILLLNLVIKKLVHYLLEEYLTERLC